MAIMFLLWIKGGQMNKKATDKVLSVYWLAILVIVAGGIFAMVYTFYHHPYDVREIEAGLMVNHVADCLSTGGKLNSVVTFEDSFKDDFMEICSLTFEVEEGELQEEVQYYLEVNFYEDENNFFSFSKGNLNLVSSCGLQEEKEQERLAKCVERGFYSLDGDKLYLIKILSIVRKTEKNVKL